MSTIIVDHWIADLLADGVRLAHATHSVVDVLGHDVPFASRLRWVDVDDLRWLMRDGPSEDHPRAHRGNATVRVQWWRDDRSGSAKLSIAFDSPMWVTRNETISLAVLLDHIEELREP